MGYTVSASEENMGRELDLQTESRVFLGDDTVFYNPPHLQGITTDSVLLAAYAAERLRTLRGEVCDLCSGSGLISLLLARRCAGIRLHGVDTDAEACRCYQKNAGENGLAPRLSVTRRAAPHGRAARLKRCSPRRRIC